MLRLPFFPKASRALLAGLALPSAAFAASLQSGQVASVVLGQTNFTTGTATAGVASRFNLPSGIARDEAAGKVYVADSGNHRVLRFSSEQAAKIGGQPEAVFGQPDFTGNSANRGGSAAANTLNSPFGLSVDSSGRLWVADGFNNRVLGFFSAATKSSGADADIVLGQPNFTTVSFGHSQAKINGPRAVSVGSGDTLWIADRGNSRVLRFDAVTAKASGANADGVLGQTNFTNFASNAASASGMTFPSALWADADGRLWVGDTLNNRVLRFDAAAGKANGADADGVLGQSDFTGSGSAAGAAGLGNVYGVCLDAEGNLWVGDLDHSRALRFPAAATLANGAAATLVLGQPNFTEAGNGTTASKLNGPQQVWPGSDGTLLVADTSNSRALHFRPIPPTPVQPAPAVVVSGKRKISTAKAKIVLKGSATDVGGTLARVEVKIGKGAYRPASGGSSWRCSVRLKSGKNVILVRAVDQSGTTSAPVKIIANRG